MQETKTQDQPAILFVHGAWHCPEHYTDLVKAVNQKGFLVVIPRLPSMNGDKPPTKGLADDIICFHHEASKLLEAGHRVLVLSHSYGGIVSTNALTSDLSISARQKAGKPGGIIHLVYMCAFLPQKGESIKSIIASSGALLDIDVDANGNAMPKNPLEAFYGDLPAARAEHWAQMLVTHPISAHVMETTTTAWESFPMTYLFCEDDQAVTFRRQKEMVQAVRDAGIDGIRTELFKASHSPFLSAPDEVAAAVQRAWDAQMVLL
jgi:pimeloyl-ACP methyl ester carboxylesterase